MVLFGTAIFDVTVGFAEPISRFELIGLGIALIGLCVCAFVNYW
jgi:hypothetical protein